MCSEEEMCELFVDIFEVFVNIVEIVKCCNVIVCFGEYFLLQFLIGDMSIEDYLVKCVKEGLEECLVFLFFDEEECFKCCLEYDECLEIEFQVINQMGFLGYFFIVMEFIQWLKDNGVLVGLGCGFGVGLLVVYVLKIIDFDLLEFDLLFECFFNLECVFMFDFDVDFCMEKCDQVIEYVVDMYGCDVVLQIIIFGIMAVKVVICDVGCVLGYLYGFVDCILKLILFDLGMMLVKVFEVELQLLEIYEVDEEVKVLIDMVCKLEGVICNVGKYVGGVVIVLIKIIDFVLFYCDEEGKYLVIQFDKSDVEYVGLVKFDFFGLCMFIIINWVLEMINKRWVKNGELLLDIVVILLDDKKSFDML